MVYVVCVVAPAATVPTSTVPWSTTGVLPRATSISGSTPLPVSATVVVGVAGSLLAMDAVVENAPSSAASTSTINVTSTPDPSVIGNAGGLDSVAVPLTGVLKVTPLMTRGSPPRLRIVNGAVVPTPGFTTMSPSSIADPVERTGGSTTDPNASRLNGRSPMSLLSSVMSKDQTVDPVPSGVIVRENVVVAPGASVAAGAVTRFTDGVLALRRPSQDAPPEAERAALDDEQEARREEPQEEARGAAAPQAVPAGSRAEAGVARWAAAEAAESAANVETATDSVDAALLALRGPNLPKGMDLTHSAIELLVTSIEEGQERIALLKSEAESSGSAEALASLNAIRGHVAGLEPRSDAVSEAAVDALRRASAAVVVEDLPDSAAMLDRAAAIERTIADIIEASNFPIEI